MELVYAYINKMIGTKWENEQNTAFKAKSQGKHVSK
jgi:hypothetical protein